MNERADTIETLLRDYYDACNAADADRIAACFTPNAVHYFPPGMYGGPFRGALTIAERWCEAVAQLGSYWIIEQLIVDAAHWRAVLEWTHYKSKQDVVLRGDEWFEIDDNSVRIAEVRAYYASPQAANVPRLELGGFDYARRGYSTAPLRRRR